VTQHFYGRALSLRCRLEETILRFWLLFVAAVPGVLAGLWLLYTVVSRLAAAVLGCVIVGYCTFAFASSHFHLPANLEKPLSPVVGFVTGLINGLTGSQIIPVLPLSPVIKP